MLANVDAVKALIRQQKNLVLAGEESVLRALPEGHWIGGTIPYFMSAEGGKTFGEIAYQLLNQTMVHISVSKRP